MTTTIQKTGTATKLAQGLAMAAMGGVMLFVAGFANANALHDNAHDTRHAIVFPCH